jgi:aspartyl/asparaginyl beta-hydroxylase (cupin superfamily)
MDRDEYNILFHRLELNLVAFKRLMDCDEEVLKLVNAAIEAERQSVLVTIDELRGMESDRNAMFSDGYDHALSHIEEFIRAREKV